MIQQHRLLFLSAFFLAYLAAAPCYSQQTVDRIHQTLLKAYALPQEAPDLAHHTTLRRAEALLLASYPFKAQHICDSMLVELEQDTTVWKALFLEMKGRIFHERSDIDAAHAVWKQAAAHKAKYLPANAPYHLETRYYEALHQQYLAPDKKSLYHSAWLNMDEVIRVLEKHPDYEPYLNTGLLLREWAYSYKVNGPRSLPRLDTTRNRLREALEVTIRRFGADSPYTADRLHDIANTYNDSSNKADSLHLRLAYLDSAQQYYERAIALREQVNERHYRNAVSYFSSGLAYYYQDGFNEQEWRQFRKSMRVIDSSISPEPFSPLPAPEGDYFDLTQIPEVVSFELFELLNAYAQTDSLIHLKRALRLGDSVRPWWRKTMKSYASKELGKSFGSFEKVPYRQAGFAAAALYEATGEELYIDSLLHFVFHANNLSLQRADSRRTANGPPTLADLRSEMTHGDAFLLFVSAQFSKWLLITSDTTVLQEKEFHRDRLAEDIHEFTTAIQQRDSEWRTKAEKVYQRAFAGLLPYQQSVQRLCIFTENAAFNLPFDLLFSVGADQDMLSQEVFTASLTGDHWFHDAVKTADANILSYTPEQRQATTLPFNQMLADHLVHRYNAKHASHIEELYAASASIWHIGTHARFDPLDPLKSFALTDGDSLTAERVKYSRSDASMVVLSACSSGEGHYLRSEGLIGLSQAFRHAGAASVLHTLWPVDDRSTAEILELFYHNLERGDTSAEALRRAKLQYLDKHEGSELAHPYYWAGLALDGIPQRYKLSTRTDRVILNNLLAIVLLTCLIIAGISYSLVRNDSRSSA
jgi:predicted negative regulator of RcsB-dependent stress response